MYIGIIYIYGFIFKHCKSVKPTKKDLRDSCRLFDHRKLIKHRPSLPTKAGRQSLRPGINPNMGNADMQRITGNWQPR